MHETSTPQLDAAPGRFDDRYISLNSLGLEPEQLDFYQLLLACAGEEGASVRQALRFRVAGCGRASFIGSLDALPAPLATFPLWRAELEGWPGGRARNCWRGRVPRWASLPAPSSRRPPGAWHCPTSGKACWRWHGRERTMRPMPR